MSSTEFKFSTAQKLDLAPESQFDDAVAESQDGFTITKAKLADLLLSGIDQGTHEEVNHETKSELKLTKREAQQMVEAFFEIISKNLADGTSVKLSGFGSFQLRDKPSRPGLNLQTGDRILIAPRRVVTFHASQKLKQQIEQICQPNG